MNLTTAACKGWKDSVEKEERLRLKWFNKNEAQFIASTLKEGVKLVSKEELDNLVETRKDLYTNAERHPRIKTEDVPNTDNHSVYHIMRPVKPEHSTLLYTSSNVGRVTYLAARMHVLPEDRYYFPETTSFRYGWKMWPCAKTMQGSKFGKSAIIRQSFYRRRAGIEQDPDYYIQPAKLSPTVCNCT
ncbi:PREDICTED: uncharacterized protein LOC108557883 [Nicrophorus vespilloides]|uniref:Uncharacterized protein LOC108557883 n=1 Tax=Nicrophorus vespilloides TaxID=110193 RepID=A0ABM1M677_NICVS|nr:PREDICTED: uncharacterized protein LOC108557883 [Nicrophorus vespilloides]